MIDSARVRQILKEIETTIKDENEIVKYTHQAFESADLDKNGVIDAQELYEVFKNLSGEHGLPEATKSQWDDMFDKLDVNKDGQLNFEEFSAFIRKNLLKLFRFHLDNMQQHDAEQEENQERKADAHAKEEAKKEIFMSLNSTEEVYEIQKPDHRGKFSNQKKSNEERIEELEEVRRVNFDNKRNQPANKNLTSSEAQKIGAEQLAAFDAYMEETGLTLSMQLIFSELISKKIKKKDIFEYVAKRLRQIGVEKGYYKSK